MDLSGVLLAAVITIIAYLWYKSRQRLPPGPWNLPILGYLPWLNPEHPYLSLTALAEKFGSVYGLHLGSVYTVVISDAKIVKKVFNKDAASGRAPLYLTHGIMNGYGLICAEGDLWKDQRKFVCTTLRMLGATKNGPKKSQLEANIQQDVHGLVQLIKDRGSPCCLDPLLFLRHSLGSSINKLVFGKSWNYDDPTWKWLQDLQEEGTKLIGVAGPLNFLPILRFLPKLKQTMRFLIEGKVKTHQIYAKIIEEESKKSDVTNFIQAFLDERSKRVEAKDGSEVFYSNVQFYHLLADVFGASLDTTLTTLRWLYLHLAQHQDIQTRLRSEILAVKKENSLSLDDLGLVPYLEATIAEVQRIRSVVPLGIPHGTTEEIEVEGYILPKGTMIVPLQWAMHLNSKEWKNSQSFEPERFLDKDGKFFKPDSFLPFQTGKRICVGEDLARMYLRLFTAGIVSNFHIGCDDPKQLDLKGECGITLNPKPHKLIFTCVKDKN